MIENSNVLIFILKANYGYPEKHISTLSKVWYLWSEQIMQTIINCRE
jgi:hypothetical protein